MHPRHLPLLATLLAALFGAAGASGQTRPDALLLRYPDVSADSIVFRYDGDLWLVAKTGGTARRLTSAPGNEVLPRFSPDGRMVAFMGSYDGSSDLYVLSLEGGLPRRVTFHPGREVLSGWTPDGEHLLYFSSETSGIQRAPKVFQVDLDGGMPDALPMSYGTFATVDPSGEWVAYTPISREWRTWNRYRGGMAQDIWLFNLRDHTSRRVTDDPGTDAAPMWHGRDLVFLSDRGPAGIANLYAWNLDSGETRQLTHLEQSGLRFPSIGPDDVVFEWRGKLQRYEFASGKVVPVPVEIPMDRPFLRPRYRDLSGSIASVRPGPKAKRVVVEARGEIFTVPAEHGFVRNLTHSSGTAERDPSWSPDGTWIAYWSDRSGEYELYLRRSDGEPFEGCDEHGEQRLTTLGPGWKYAVQWSPDSKKLAFSLQSGELYLHDLETHELIRVSVNPSYGPLEVDWSADSNWITWSQRHSQSRNNAIQLYSLPSRQHYEVTSGMFNDSSPAFDPAGSWLYFISDRTFSPTYSELDSTWIYDRVANLIAVPLRGDVENPFLAENDEEPIAAEASTSKEPATEKPAEEEKKSVESEPLVIETEGFEARAIALPVESGGLSDLAAIEGKILYLRHPQSGSTHLCQFDLKKKKESTLLDTNAFQVTPDGKKLLISRGRGWAFVDPAPGQEVNLISMKGVAGTFDPREEWPQLIRDVYRIYRDWFYDPGMHGVDWEGVRDRALAALPDATSRADVTFLIGEMIAELNVGHAYNRGSSEDDPHPPGPAARVGLLGCDWSLEQGAYRIAHILGSPYDTDARSPLAAPGLDVHEGDWLLAVNGVDVDPTLSIHAALIGTAGRATSLLLCQAPSRDGSEREVVVVPLSSERNLRYRDWVAAKRAYVDEHSGGRVGYIHVPSTGIGGQNELVRQFMGQYHKDALIVDERWNSGGQIPTRFIELLSRKTTNAWATRSGEDWLWPPVAHRGPKVMLINYAAGSGGDAFPYYFRQAGLGKLIGTRTWGGLVGISGNPSLIDGGSVSVPTFAFYELDGTWGIEGHGVEPDIEVLDDPAKMLGGADPQLDAAIAELQAELAEWSDPTPKRPPYRDRSGAGIEEEDK